MKRIIIILMMLSISHSAFAQYDSTNLPGISANVAFVQQPGNVRLPDTLVLDQATQYTETAVLACPSGYYANGAVPTDGSSTTSQVSGGVIEERSVTTDRFGTTSYGAWTQVNFLCTAIPPAPQCPAGQNQISAPYWDSNTNQWLGLQCQQQVQVMVQATPLTYCRTSYQCDYPYSDTVVNNSTVSHNWALTNNQAYLASKGWIPSTNGIIIYHSYNARNNYVFWCPSTNPNLVNIDLVHYFQTGSTIANQKTNTTMCHQ